MKTEYKNAKSLLKERANFIKKEYPKNKPLQIEVVNNHLDFLCKNYKFSEYKINLLTNYAYTLRHKN